MKEIKLTQGRVTLVDNSDFEWLNQWKWYAQNTKSGFYAVRKIRSADKDKCILMHRLIMGIVDIKIKTDHKDRDTLNNRRKNLRASDHSQNMANRKASGSSKYLGVHWCKTRKKWTATITSNNKKKHIGYSDSEKNAALSYNEAAKIMHGKFANLNKI